MSDGHLFVIRVELRELYYDDGEPCTTDVCIYSERISYKPAAYCTVATQEYERFPGDLCKPPPNGFMICAKRAVLRALHRSFGAADTLHACF